MIIFPKKHHIDSLDLEKTPLENALSMFEEDIPSDLIYKNLRKTYTYNKY